MGIEEILGIFRYLEGVLGYVEAILGLVVVILSLIGQLVPKKVKLLDIVRSLLSGKTRRVAVLVLLLSIIPLAFPQLEALRLPLLTLAGICTLYLIIILGGPARRILFPTSDNPKRMARLKTSKVVVGGKEYLEQSILCELMARLIERDNPNLTVERHFRLHGTLAVYAALQLGEIDLYVEYTGTALFYLLKLPLEEVKDKQIAELNDLFRDMNLEWLEPLGYSNSYVLVMLRQKAEQLGVTSISELSSVSHNLRLRGTNEFCVRPDGLPGLQREYGLHFASQDIVLEQNRYHALRNGEMDVTSGFATDPEINLEDNTFIVLEDDRQFFPSYYAIPLVHCNLLTRFPSIKMSLGKVAGAISEKEMARLLDKGIELGFDQKPDSIGVRALVDRFLREKAI